MNKPLIKAENDLINLLEKHPDGLDRDTIMEKLTELGNKEAEIRAAFWTIGAQFQGFKLKLPKYKYLKICKSESENQFNYNPEKHGYDYNG